MREQYNMAVNETITIDDFKITRVPGGWIYRFNEINQTMMINGKWSENYLPTAVFVPYKNEFV
uniref:Uncharacterized protein n=1 Tax=viral metagenome TaxID=1070528 RepID=A0A6M3JKP6_9ZZZZ